MPPLDRYCPRCGAACSPSAQLCPSCGSSLKATVPLDSPFPLRTVTDHLAPNQVLKERYLILSQVGLGGFGAVYKAQDLGGSNRLVAIKEISLRGLSPQQVIEATGSFNREVLLLSHLKHPGIPCIYEQFTDPEHWYLVMEFIEGETLEAYLTKVPDGCLPLDEVLRIGMRLCTLLEYLHTQQPPLIFRDLKPANIMLTPRHGLYLIDFGVARRFQPGKTKDTIAFGSPGYAAPEQYGRAQTTPHADIYSLGATLHQLLTGLDPSLSPFRFVPLRTHNPASPPELENLLARMLELAVDKRPASAALVRQELSHIAALPDVQRTHLDKDSKSFSAANAFPTFSTRGVTVYIYSGHQAPILSLAWSPDGQRIASTGEDHTVRIWDAFSGGKRLHYLDWASVVSDLAWSPDGQRLALASEDHTVHVIEIGPKPGPWRALALALGYKSTRYDRHAGKVNAVSWAPNGQFIASGDDVSAIHIWHARSRETLLVYQGHSDVINAVAWAPDGHRMASTSIDHSVRVWHAFSKENSMTHRQPGAIFNAVCWSPGGRYVALASSNRTVQIWDVAARRRVYTYMGHKGSVLAVAWSPDGQRIASASSDTTVQIWDPLNPDGTFIYDRHEDKVFTLAWSPDGLHIASAGEDRLVHVWKTT